MNDELGRNLTFIGPKQVEHHQNRHGFEPICRYGSIEPVAGEIGGIYKGARNTRMEMGLFVYEAECVERIIVRED